MLIDHKMAKQDQVLILDPAQELHFKGPFTDVVTSYLKLNNPSDRKVCFKVKTTAPKKYCVRPNSGTLQPKQIVSVAVMLQPFDYNPNEKNKHKFMVQTMFVPEGDVNSSTDDLWRDAKPESLMDSKLKCVFDMSIDGVQNNNLDMNAIQIEDKTNAASKLVPETSVEASPKVTNTDHELKKILEDNERLMKECKFLKQENEKLKQEQQRRLANPSGDGGARSGAGSKTISSNPSPKEPMPTFSEKEQAQSPMLYLAVILTIGLLGIFIGKFIV